MPTTKKLVRQSVSLPNAMAKQVRELARSSGTSVNRVLVMLIKTGLEAREQERRRFLELADRLAESTSAGEQARLKEELARMTFGE